MKTTYCSLLVVLMFVAVTAVASWFLTATNDSHAQATKQVTAVVTAEIVVPDGRRFIRFEDPEYKVVCYLSVGAPYMGCVKK